MIGITQDVLNQELVMQLTDNSNMKSRASAPARSVGSITDRFRATPSRLGAGNRVSSHSRGYQLRAVKAMILELAQSILRL